MADLDCAACLPAAVHPLWDNAVCLKVKHLIDVFPRFSCNTHHIEKGSVIAVIDPAFHHHFQKEITMSRRAKSNIRHKNSPFLNLTKFGCHQPVKLCVSWELVDKRHKGAADFQKPLSCTDIRDIAHLKVGDVKELGKFKPVGGRLV